MTQTHSARPATDEVAPYDVASICRFVARLGEFEPDDPDSCCRWTGGLYGSTPGFYDKGKMTSARRFSYQTFIGEIPEKAAIYTTCGSFWCVRPEHLEPVVGVRRS